MRRACIFVDGENFRHSLKQLFPSGRYSFGKGDYLPETDWHTFFTSLAARFHSELLRVYWYVIEHIDCRPYKIPGVVPSNLSAANLEPPLRCHPDILEIMPKELASVEV